jgi:pimeloyl-ACP methyl ester carboxylesterase
MQVQKAYVTTPHGQLHYRHAIPSTPSKLTTLIFLHKSASSSASMMKLMSHFSSLGHACYAPDMPGFGASFDPSPAAIEDITQEGISWYCDLYAQVFRDLGIWNEQPGVHILGHHSGAALAPKLAVMFPAIVRSICLVGPTVVNEVERIAMRDRFLVPFNTPEPSGGHLTKTWDYLGRMGVTSAGACSSPPTSCTEADLELWQREVLDHLRAWKGRMQIYGAVWAVDSETIFKQVGCPIMALCAKDDVLYEHLDNVKKVRDDDDSVVVGTIGGANFSIDRDVEGLISYWTPFLDDLRI